jgi:purine-binding chemotaxis protein CheW
MSRPVDIATRPQLALQTYLDGLLQDATEEQQALADGLDEFQAAVREEQARDAQVGQVAVAEAAPARVAPVAALVPVAPLALAPVEPVSETAPSAAPPAPITPIDPEGRPAWASEAFECLLFDVAGLTLAVPLVCLGTIYPLANQELTPLFGQPNWFLGLLPSQSGNLKVLDTARWVMPERYREDFQEGLQYVISVQGYEWGLAVHQVSRSLRLDPDQIKWRSQRGQRPWLAGTVIEHMCALLDVAALAELIASGAAKHLQAPPPAGKAASKPKR